MRNTFRTFSWEYGLLIGGMSSVLFLLVTWILPNPIMVLLIILSSIYLVYSMVVVTNYPTRGDLPEWRQWESKVGADDYRD